MPACWATKRNNRLVQLTSARQAELGVKKVLKVGFGHLSWNEGKVPVDVYIYHSTSARVVKPGNECKKTTPGIVTWIEHVADMAGVKVGDAVLVCPDVSECEKHNRIDSRPERPRKTFEQMADTRIQNLRDDTPQKVRSALIAAVVQCAIKREAALSRKHPVMFALMAGQMHDDLFFDRHRDLCKLLGVEPSLDRYKNKDWRGTSRRIFQGNAAALMVAMTLMHQYHVGIAEPGEDALPRFLRLYRIQAKPIERRVLAATAEKVDAIHLSLKRRKAKHQKQAKASKQK